MPDPDPYAAIATPVADPYAAIAQPIQAKPRTWLDSVGDMAGEMWKKVNPVTAVQGLAQAANHPLDTGKGLLDAQGELANKAEAAFKKGNYVEGVRHVLNYLTPIIGPQTDEAGDLAQQGQYAKAAGQTLGIGANIAAPELLKGLPLKVPGSALSERMYQSALKPSTTLSTGQVKSMVDTGLENKIPVSAEGAQKLNGLISDLGDKVKAKIQAATNSGATIDPTAVASRTDALKNQFSNQVNPGSDLAAIDASKQEFLQRNPNSIPAAVAQDLKQGTYKQLSGKYGELSNAAVESQKALARGIKEELEVQFPEIKGMNADQGKMIGLDAALNRAVKRIDNRDIFSLGGKITGAAGATVGGAPGGMAGFVLHHVVSSPEVQSKLAIALSRATKGEIQVSAATARIAGYANALGHSLDASQPSGSQAQP